METEKGTRAGLAPKDAPTDAIEPKARAFRARVRDEETAPSGWSRAWALATDAKAPPEPAWWPFWQVSPRLRVRLLDALNLTIERRTENGAWVKIGEGIFGRSMSEIAKSLRRRGLSDAKDMPVDDRRWPYDMGARS